LAVDRVRLHLAQDPAADELLSDNSLALLIGMVLDQQVPLEWAFSGPLELERRLGRPLEAETLAAMDPDALAELFSRKPALHRYPGAMAKRVQELSRMVVDEYGGHTDHIWKDVGSASELLARVQRMPGFGEHKAKIFVALLGKQLGVRPEGWVEVSSPFGEPGSLRSVADIVDGDSLRDVRAWKQQAKADAKIKAKPGARTNAHARAKAKAPGAASR
jgi:uncharacterized HhH-GPD family protein